MTTPVRQFARSSGAMAVLYAGSTALTFLVGALLARLLGAGGYGVYALAMTTATLAGMVTEFGLPVLAMRETGAARASGDWGALRGLLHWADRAILALSLALIAATWAGVLVFAPERASAYLATLLWAVALVPFVAVGKLRAFVLLALDRTFASQAPVMILRPLLFLAGCVALWQAWGGLTPEAAMAAQVGGAAMAMAVSLALYRRFRPAALGLAAPVYAVRSWLAACLPMGLSEGLRLLQGQLALLLTGALATAAEAGIYRVADAAAQITALFASIAGTAATPMFARLWQAGDREGTERVAVLAAWTMLGGALLLGAPLALLGDWLFPWVFGAEFAPSVAVFRVLWLGSLVWSCGGLALALANMTGHHVLATRAFAVIALVNLVAGFALVPRLGALGAAWACALAMIAGTAYCAWRLFRLTGLNCTLANPAALAVLAAAIRGGLARLVRLGEGRAR